MDLLNLQSEIKKTVKVKGLDFDIKAILPNERLEIAVKKSYLLGAVPLESISYHDAILAEKMATIDSCVDFPDAVDWNSSRDIPDISIIETLFEEIKNLTLSLEKKLKKNKSFEGSAKA